jgi:hypothetical protein
MKYDNNNIIITSRAYLQQSYPWGGVTHIQYDDDTLIIVEGSKLDIRNLKFLILYFKEMAGL